MFALGNADSRVHMVLTSMGESDLWMHVLKKSSNKFSFIRFSRLFTKNNLFAQSRSHQKSAGA